MTDFNSTIAELIKLGLTPQAAADVAREAAQLEEAEAKRKHERDEAEAERNREREEAEAERKLKVELADCKIILQRIRAERGETVTRHSESWRDKVHLGLVCPKAFNMEECKTKFVRARSREAPVVRSPVQGQTQSSSSGRREQRKPSAPNNKRAAETVALSRDVLPLSESELMDAAKEYVLKAKTCANEAQLQVHLMKLLGKFLHGFAERTITDTSARPFLKGRKPDASLHRAEVLISALSVQAVVELKHTNPAKKSSSMGKQAAATATKAATSAEEGHANDGSFTAEHLGQAMNTTRLLLESQPWRSRARCLVIDDVKVNMLESVCGHNGQIHLYDQSLSLTDVKAIYLIHEFLCETEFVHYRMPSKFTSVDGASTVQTTWDMDSMSLLASSRKGSVYLGMSDVGEEQGRVLKIHLDTGSYKWEKKVLLHLSRTCPDQSLLLGYSDTSKALLQEYLGSSLRSQSSCWTRNAFVGLVDSLKQLHEAGIIHRDIKPGNIVLKRLGTRGARFIDFGCSADVQLDEGYLLEVLGSYVGTLEYSPQDHLEAPPHIAEAPAGLRYDASTDLQSLVKTWAYSVFNTNALMGLHPVFNDDLTLGRANSAKNWRQLEELIPVFRQAYLHAKQVNYEGVKEVFRSAPFYASLTESTA